MIIKVFRKERIDIMKENLLNIGGNRVIRYDSSHLTDEQFRELQAAVLTDEEIAGVIAAVEGATVEPEAPLQPGVRTPSAEGKI
jgi:hypothetical protein